MVRIDLVLAAVARALLTLITGDELRAAVQQTLVHLLYSQPTLGGRKHNGPKPSVAAFS